MSHQLGLTGFKYGKTKCSPGTQGKLGSASKKAGRSESSTTARVLEASLVIHSHGRCPGGQRGSELEALLEKGWS